MPSAAKLKGIVNLLLSPIYRFLQSYRRQLAVLVGGLQHELLPLSIDEGLALIIRRLNLSVDITVDYQYKYAHLSIVGSLAGHTQAISIAAAQLARRGADFAITLANRISEGFGTDRPFHDLQIIEEDRQLSLETSLYLSYEDLSDDLKQCFRVLGLFVSTGTFNAHAVQAILSDDPTLSDEIDTGATEDKLDALVDAALIIRHNNRRYSLHRVLKYYAQSLLRQTSEISETHPLFSMYYIGKAIRTFNKSPEEWQTDDLPQIYEVGDFHAAEMAGTRLIPDYLDNLKKFSNEVVDREELFLVVAEHFGVTIQPYVKMRSIGLRGLGWLLAALVAARTRDSKASIASLSWSIGDWYEARGETVEAVKYYFQAIEMWHILDDKPNIRRALLTVTPFFAQAKHVDVVREFLKSASEWTEEADGVANLELWGMLAGIYFELGDYDNALENGLKALSRCDSQTDKNIHASILNNLGNICAQTGRFDEAINYLEEALGITILTGDVRRQATCLLNIGQVFKDKNDIGSAITAFATGAELAIQVDDAQLEYRLQRKSALLLREIGQTTLALVSMRRAKALKVAFGIPTIEEEKYLREWQSSDNDGLG